MHRRRASLTWLLALLLSAATLAQGELVIVKDGVYHRPACPVIRGTTDVLAMNVGQAEARGFKSHPDCDPNVSKTPGTAVEPVLGDAGKPPKPPQPIYVFVDPGGTQYHKETCLKLGKSPNKVELTASVAKKYWPCGVCKPPILPRPPKKK